MHFFPCFYSTVRQTWFAKTYSQTFSPIYTKLHTPKEFFRVLKHADLNSKMICSFSSFLFCYCVVWYVLFVFSTSQKNEDATKLQTCHPCLKENQGRAAIERSSRDNTRYTVPVIITLVLPWVSFSITPKAFPKIFVHLNPQICVKMA